MFEISEFADMIPIETLGICPYLCIDIEGLGKSGETRLNREISHGTRLNPSQNDEHERRKFSKTNQFSVHWDMSGSNIIRSIQPLRKL